ARGQQLDEKAIAVTRSVVVPWSGRRDSNPRPFAWEANAPPTAPLPLRSSESTASRPSSRNCHSGAERPVEDAGMRRRGGPLRHRRSLLAVALLTLTGCGSAAVAHTTPRPITSEASGPAATPPTDLVTALATALGTPAPSRRPTPRPTPTA